MRLIDIAGHLQGVNEEVKELGEDVMKDNVVEKRVDPKEVINQQELNVLTARHLKCCTNNGACLALSNTDDPDEALNITISGIEAQPDPFVYTKIVESHLKNILITKRKLIEL